MFQKVIYLPFVHLKLGEGGRNEDHTNKLHIYPLILSG